MEELDYKKLYFEAKEELKNIKQELEQLRNKEKNEANQSTLSCNFERSVSGFHKINSSCLKESQWEEINRQILECSGFTIKKMANGSHISGMDIDSEYGRLSNKTAKYNKKRIFSISSYRLTTICGKCNHGTPELIISEINRRKNFDSYSLLVREEMDDEILYDWYIIPANFYLFLPETFTWEPLIKKKTGKQNGWKTNEINGFSMKINYSMSSQLWIKVESSFLEEFIIASVKVNKNNNILYRDI